MSDYAREMERAQVLNFLFWDGTVTQAQIDNIAHQRYGYPPGTSYEMPPPPDDYVATPSPPVARSGAPVDRPHR